MYEESWIKLLKYFILASFFILEIGSIKMSRLITYVFMVCVFSLLYVFSCSYSLTFKDFAVKILPYAAPASIFLLFDGLRKCNWEKLIRVITYLSIITCFIEYFFFKHLIWYFNFMSTEGFYRAVSIFFNPNNAGVMFFLMFYYYCFVKMIKHGDISFENSLICILLMVCIIFTSSKTPLVLVPLSMILFICFKNFKLSRRWVSVFQRTIITLCVLAVLTIPIFLISDKSLFFIREITIETGTQRFDQIIVFFDKLSKNFLYPNYNLPRGEIVDNTYIQLWIDFGFLGMLLFLACFLMPLIKKRRICLYGFTAILLLLISGLTLNVFYLLPTAYVFWYIIFQESYIHKPIKIHHRTDDFKIQEGIYHL